MTINCVDINNKESLGYFNELVKVEGFESTPPRLFIDGRMGTSYKLITLEGCMKFLVNKWGTMVGNPIKLKELSEEEKQECLKEIVSICKEGVFINGKWLEFFGISSFPEIDKNYYYNVKEQWEKCSKGKWKRKRGVITDNKVVEFRKLNKYDTSAIEKLHSFWKANKSKTEKSAFSRMYSTLIKKNKYFGLEFESYGLFYRGALVAFKYINVDSNNIANDYFLNSASPFTGEELKNYLRYVVTDTSYMENYSLHLRDVISEHIQIIKNSSEKDPRKQNSILEVERLKSEWKTDALRELEKFIKINSLNTFRYHFMEELNNRNINYCFEDFAVDNKLKEYKENKVGCGVPYYRIYKI